MDYTKVYKFISSSSRTVTIFYDEGSQWLGNYYAIFNADSLPELTADNVLPLIGVDSNTKATYNTIVEHRDINSLTGSAFEGDGSMYLCKLSMPGIAMFRREGSNGPECIFVNAAAVKPLMSDPDITYKCRYTKEYGNIIIAMCGMISAAVILPLKIGLHHQKAIEDMETAVTEMKRQLSELENQTDICEQTTL